MQKENETRNSCAPEKGKDGGKRKEDRIEQKNSSSSPHILQLGQPRRDDLNAEREKLMAWGETLYRDASCFFFMAAG